MTASQARAYLDREQMTAEEQRVHGVAMEAFALAGNIEDGCNLLRVATHLWTDIMALWVTRHCPGDWDRVRSGVFVQAGLLGEVLEAKLTLRGMLDAQLEMRWHESRVNGDSDAREIEHHHPTYPHPPYQVY